MCFYHGDDEYCPVWNMSVVKGRKEYTCESCNRKILPGEQQLYIFYVQDGAADAYRICNQCVQDEAAIARYERKRGCTGSEAHPYWQDVHRLICRGDPDGDWEPEFEWDDSCEPHVLFWPYGVPPAKQPVDLKQIPEYAN